MTISETVRLLVLAVCLACSGLLFPTPARSQAPSPEGSIQRNGDSDIYDITSTIRQIGTLGILAWFCWYTTAKAQPRMIDAFRREMQLERDAHRAEVASYHEANSKVSIATAEAAAEAAKSAAEAGAKMMANHVAAIEALTRQYHEDTLRIASVQEKMLQHCSMAIAAGHKMPAG